MTRNKLQPYKFRIVFKRGPYTGSAIHTFYAPNQQVADFFAKGWARHRNATKLTRIRKESHERQA